MSNFLIEIGWTPAGFGYYHRDTELAEQEDGCRLSEIVPVKVTADTVSPITEDDVEAYKSGYGADVAWMLPEADSRGTVYESADGRVSRRPRIFVDEIHGVLYFEMHD